MPISNDTDVYLVEIRREAEVSLSVVGIPMLSISTTCKETQTSRFTGSWSAWTNTELCCQVGQCKVGGRSDGIFPPEAYGANRTSRINRTNRTNRIRLLGLSASLLAGGEIRLPQLLPGPGQYRPCKAKPQLMSNTGAYIPFTGGGAMPAISSAMPGA